MICRSRRLVVGPRVEPWVDLPLNPRVDTIRRYSASCSQHKEVDVPSEIFFSSGGSVKVTADLDDVRTAIGTAPALETQRFAGFRGDEVVGGERTIVQVDAIAYAMAIAAP
jgi:hypothetical protein